MFRCQRCQAVTPPRTPSRLIVTETRARIYPARASVFPKYVATTKGRRRVRNEWKDDPGGVGHETVRALRVCPTCAAALGGR